MLKKLILNEIKSILHKKTNFEYNCSKVYDDAIYYSFLKDIGTENYTCLDICLDDYSNILIVNLSDGKGILINTFTIELKFDIFDKFNALLELF